MPAGRDAFAGKAPILVGEGFGFRWKNQCLEAVVGSAADGCFRKSLQPAVGALCGEPGRQDENVLAVRSEFGACVFYEPFDGGVLKKTRIAGPQPADNLFTPLLIPDHCIPGRETDGAGMCGIRQWNAEILLLPGGVCQKIAHER